MSSFRTSAITNLLYVVFAMLLTFALSAPGVEATSSTSAAFLLAPGDCDDDGIPDDLDPDDDNDGVPDDRDPEPCNPLVPGSGQPVAPEPNDPTSDKDGDGIPDDLDPDDNNNGIQDKDDPQSGSSNNVAKPGGNSNAPVVSALPSTGAGPYDASPTLLSLSVLTAIGLASVATRRKQ